jgi:hypothetical protein
VARLLSTVGLDFGPSATITTVQEHNICGIVMPIGRSMVGPALTQGNRRWMST